MFILAQFTTNHYICGILFMISPFTKSIEVGSILRQPLLFLNIPPPYRHAFTTLSLTFSCIFGMDLLHLPAKRQTYITYNP